MGFPDDVRDWGEFRVSRYTLAVLASGESNHHRGSWPLFLLTASLTALVLLSVAFPQALFRLRYALSVYNAEPSDFYLFAQKAGWYIFPALLLISYIVSLVLVT